MQVYNADETGINVVYKPGKVASGVSLPLLMVYPRKRSVPNAMRVGAPPGTVFRVTDSGWMTKEIYLQWFQHFHQLGKIF